MRTKCRMMNSDFNGTKECRTKVQLAHARTVVSPICGMIAVLMFLSMTGGHDVFAQQKSGKYKASRPAGNDYQRDVVWVKVKPSYAAVLSSPGGRVAPLPGVASSRPLVPAVNVP